MDQAGPILYMLSCVTLTEVQFLLTLKLLSVLPGGAVDMNLPANAGKHGFNPRSGKFPHATEQLSTTTEPAELALQLLNPHAAGTQCN